MSGPPPGFGLPFGDDPEMFKDAPLFRELQRVMSSSTGPVNWELARQVGIAGAAESGEDRAPTETEGRAFEEAVRVAELHVARFTGLEPPGDVAQVGAIRRAEWVTASVEGLKSLIEPAATRLTEAIDRASREQLPDEAREMGGFMAQLSPLLMGTQAGNVLGALAQHVLGQYDVALPRSGAGTLLFVMPNIADFERSWSLDPTDFRTWVAIHEVTHRFEFARPWALERFRALLDDFLSTVTIDMEGMQSRLSTLEAADPEALRGLMGSDEGLFGTKLDDEQRLKLARIQAFMAAAEGYGDHVTHAVGSDLLPSHARIEEAMRRYREDETSDPVFERMLGVEMKREHYAAGRRFCDMVVEQTDEATLALMWDGPDAMPSWPEIEEARLWLARTV